MSASLLQTIVAATRRAVAEREAHAPLASLRAEEMPAREVRAFTRAFDLSASGARIIAECKRRSPSKGMLRENYDAASIAAAYERAGAAAISVLTEPAFFDGELAHLADVRAAVQIPILRKDFIVSRYQIAEARVAGADAVLLIVAALSEDELTGLLAIASEYGIDALVETHDRAEIARAVDAGARLIGVNSRDLHTLDVDTNRLEELAAAVPRDVIAIAESGIRDAATISRLGKAGYRGFLVGERFMSTPDPGAALREMIEASMTGARRGAGPPAGD